MTGRVEFFALSAEIEKMLQQGHSAKYVFEYFSEQAKFTQSYQTFLRYIQKYKKLTSSDKNQIIQRTRLDNDKEYEKPKEKPVRLFSTPEKKKPFGSGLHRPVEEIIGRI